MRDSSERYDNELGKQVANDYLDTYLKSNSFTRDLEVRWWYETWIKENRPEIFSFWKEEEDNCPYLKKRTQSLENYLNRKEKLNQEVGYVQEF